MIDSLTLDSNNQGYTSTTSIRIDGEELILHLDCTPENSYIATDTRVYDCHYNSSNVTNLERKLNISRELIRIQWLRISDGTVINQRRQAHRVNIEKALGRDQYLNGTFPIYAPSEAGRYEMTAGLTPALDGGATPEQWRDETNKRPIHVYDSRRVVAVLFRQLIVLFEGVAIVGVLFVGANLAVTLYNRIERKIAADDSDNDTIEDGVQERILESLEETGNLVTATAVMGYLQHHGCTPVSYHDVLRGLVELENEGFIQTTGPNSTSYELTEEGQRYLTENPDEETD
ncbi:hypothetical protein [Halorussus sp. MSC15.2]|uniref:hypothetical protein n=1 Tax=Halorussus sp. MSC15.2 TaxID=2283638 RepID=UPI0013D3848B|nr:hypothetical protein [Halorussus sp. MSC15.2]NEU59215.1 hypothetical protein [Halorussus sp. MSC15.2]